jgi:MFS family permease
MENDRGMHPMNSLPNAIRPYVKKLLWILLGIAIIHQGIRQYFFARFDTDKTIQIAGARWLGMGQGLNIIQANPADLSNPVNEPIVGWPPGYSLVIAPLLAILDNIWWTALIIDWISISVFFLAWFVILELLGSSINLPAKLFIWFYWAFIFNPLMRLTSSGMLSLALFSVGLAICLWLINRNSSFLWLGAATGFVTGASAAARFAYWPLLVVFPLALALTALLVNRKLLRAVIAYTTVAGSIIMSVVLSQRLATGHTTVLSYYYEESHFYWHKFFQYLRPFPISAIGFENFAWWYHWAPELNQFLTPELWWIAAAIIVIIFWVDMIVHLKLITASAETMHNQTASLFYYTSAALTFILTVSMLAYLSFRYPREVYEHGYNWLGDFRYYAPIYPFLIVSLARTAFNFSMLRRNWSYRVLAGLTGLLLLASTISVGLWRERMWRLGVDVDYTSASPAGYQPGWTVLINTVQQALASDLPVVYLDDNRTRLRVAAMAGGRFVEMSAIPDFQFKTTSPVWLIVAASPEENEAMVSTLPILCQQYEGTIIDVSDMLLLCEFRLNPDQANGGEDDK